MAAGLITVANKSGGPEMDIVDNGINGFLATSAEEYAKVFDNILSKPFNHWNDLRNEARSKCNTFTDQKFASVFTNCMKDLLA